MADPGIVVITPSLPERWPMLQEAMESVRGQTVPPVAHLVGVDHGRRGGGVVRNELLRSVHTGWVATLDDDDDVLLRQHLERLLASAEGAEVVHSAWVSEGWRPDGWTWETAHVECSYVTREQNSIASTALVRSQALRRVGGYRSGFLEDWDLWLRMKEAGMRFRCVHERTWRYRMHGANNTHRRLGAAGGQ